MNKPLTHLTVTQLNRQIRSLLEYDVGEVNVAGEISNLSKPSSGHFYFTLKDEHAQLRCVFFRSHHNRECKLFENGHQVIAKGKLSLYEARGDYQLIVQELSTEGTGELYRQFELLKVKLEQQGLFAQARKRPIPAMPTAIAIITSASGAAIQDMLTTLARRFPVASVHVYHSEVQGKGAAQQLCKAILQANKDNQTDVILLARGGGSIEDLWAFNDEQLALAIANSTIPIVSGVGHETDFTIADFVADLRAATPTAAAEAVTPHQTDLLGLLENLVRRMLIAISGKLKHYQLVLSHRLAKIASPEHLVTNHWQNVDYLERRLNQQLQTTLRQYQHDLQIKLNALHAKNPIVQLQQAKLQLTQFEQLLNHSFTNYLTNLKQSFTQRLTTLHAVSPLATLDRGYALATHNNHIIFDANQVNKGDLIHLRLAKGSLECQITDKEN